ncbi:HCP-like protein [Coniophora puteana RWD-64-598 SS2]|uniref:HCP-like protein n=1 Tax=Coniophora puteana (strain RWD-64-598) TaxID=741705 RepID=A0A5M3N4C8_CONPW|nr:HCP-like protein [Coniophora puteana RWD-64-598 SS2]EIW86279.1 HCP-like protein [Coniophora puteana RWD-64-598 SS2]
MASSTATSQIVIPKHPPSFRADSPTSLYSNSYSFYQLDEGGGNRSSPSSSGTRVDRHRSSPLASPAGGTFPRSGSGTPNGEPQSALEFLQLGIQAHEGNKLRDSAVYFEQSATVQGGCGVGMLMWGLALRHGWGCQKNEKVGFKWLTKAAESAVGDLESAREGLDIRVVKTELVLAIYEVGQCFFQGWGVTKDQKMAVSYYRVAANLGDADAQQDLAFCLANGKGCKKDKKEAAKWYRAAVAQGASDVGLAWIYKPKYSS